MDYHIGRDKAGVDYDAGKLLTSLRPEVEKILMEVYEELDDQLPTCPSQSMRARAAIRAIDNTSISNPAERLEYRVRWWRKKNMLEFFLACHAVVTHMENCVPSPA